MEVSIIIKGRSRKLFPMTLNNGQINCHAWSTPSHCCRSSFNPKDLASFNQSMPIKAVLNVNFPDYCCVYNVMIQKVLKHLTTAVPKLMFQIISLFTKCEIIEVLTHLNEKHFVKNDDTSNQLYVFECDIITSNYICN
jgi:hypothetical protein